MARREQKGPVGFRIIGGFKVVGSLLLFAAGVGLFRLVNRDVGETLEHIAQTWRLDSHNRRIDAFISWAGNVDPHKIREVGIGTFFYATLYAVEGLGLVFERTWAGYLTVFATGSLIPLEIYEVAHKPNATKVVVLVVNVAILAYLVVKLIQERRAAKAAPAGS